MSTAKSRTGQEAVWGQLCCFCDRGPPEPALRDCGTVAQNPGAGDRRRPCECRVYDLHSGFSFPQNGKEGKLLIHDLVSFFSFLDLIYMILTLETKHRCSQPSVRTVSERWGCLCFAGALGSHREKSVCDNGWACSRSVHYLCRGWCFESLAEAIWGPFSSVWPWPLESHSRGSLTW